MNIRALSTLQTFSPVRPSLDGFGLRPTTLGKPQLATGFESTARAPLALSAALPWSAPSAPVPNEFSHRISGQYPPRAAGGFFTQLYQGMLTSELAANAAVSVATGGHEPPDFVVSAMLRSLGTTPVTGDPRSVTHSDYSSRIPGASPKQAYEYFVNNPSAVFGAAGLSFRPAPTQLKDGQRLMVEDRGVPPMWMPIEVHLDPANNRVHITTLDGHALRGTNDFHFVDDGAGGTRVDQRTEFQGSSPLTSIGISLLGALQGQEKGWTQVHTFLYRQLASAA